MDSLRLDNADVGTLCLLLLTLTTAAYLVSVPRKSRGTWWLTGTAAALALHLLALLGEDLALSSLDLTAVGPALPALLTLDSFFLAFSAIASVGFAYEFLTASFPREERWATRAAGGVAGVLVIALVLTAVTPTMPPRAVAEGALALTVLAYAWAAVVLARKGWAEERAAAAGRAGPAPPGALRILGRAFGRPTTRSALAFRAFAVLMPVGSVVGLARYALQFHGAGGVLGSLSLLVLVLGLLVLFVSYAPEPTTLQAKVVAFVLAAALTALSGAVTLGNSPDDLARSSGVVVPGRAAIRLVPTEGGGYRVDAAEASLGAPGEPVATPNFWGGARLNLGFEFPFGGRSWRTVEVFPSGYVGFGAGGGAGGTPVIVPLYVPPSPETWDDARIYVRREPTRAVVTWLAVTSAAAEEYATFQVVLEQSGTITLRYGDVGFVRSLVRAVLPQGAGAAPVRLEGSGPFPSRIPPAGLVQTGAAATDAHVSRRLLPWIWLVFGATAVVLLGLPILLRTSVTRPLGRLLEGVRRAEAGDLSTEVPVEALDEVGRLTAHFNRMTGSLRGAQDELRAYAATLEDRVASRTAELAERNGELSAEKAALAEAIQDLRAAQARLVQQEKLASLGRLTSGIAHEIKNPLNFVNNFAELNAELVDELRAELSADTGAAPAVARASDLFDDLAANTRKIAEHGGRADAIVRGMMEHARGGSEPRQAVNVNDLVEGQVRAALEGRPGGAGSAEVVWDLGDEAGSVEAAPQEISRAIFNLVANAVDAVAERAKQEADVLYRPTVTVRTRRAGGQVEVQIEDNGGGLSSVVQERMFEPFYTTKPTGAGHVGLGLSLARDAVVGHGGELDVASEEGRGATFTITFPTLAQSRPVPSRLTIPQEPTLPPV